MKKSLLLLTAVGATVALAAGARRQKRSLVGKVVLLTGGSRGLGLQLARELAKEHCKLILVARSEKELTAAKEELDTRSDRVSFITCDLTDPEQLAEMLQTAKAIFGRIDIVVNDAGRIDVGPVDSFTEADFHQSMNLMFWAPVRIILALLPDLLQTGDSDIVNISSIGGKIAVPHLLPYSSAKFALTGFSEGLDAEVRHRGVHVLTVSPGLLRDGAHKKARFRGNQSEEYKWFALGATIPGISMDVARAAKQIVSALKLRRRELHLSWTAQVAARFHGSFPSMSSAAMSLMNEVLPAPVADSRTLTGAQLDASQSKLFKFATGFGETAAKSQHEN